MQGLKKLDIKRFNGAEFIDTTDEVSEEVSLAIRINQDLVLYLNCSPLDLEELILGHLFTAGIINRLQDILQLDVQYSAEDPGVQSITAEVTIAASIPAIKRTGTTSGVIAAAVFKGLDEDRRQLTLNLKTILKLPDLFVRTDTLFLKTGGTHSVALIRGTETLVVKEDIGRHNALDKVIGFAVKHEVDLKECLLLLSGRIASEMLLKAMRAEIAAVVSKSAPTLMSIHLAKENDVTLIGFLRNGQFNLYHQSKHHQFI